MLLHYTNSLANIATQEQLHQWIKTLNSTATVTPNIQHKCNYVNGCQSWIWVAGSYNGSWQFVYDSKTVYGLAIARIIVDCVNGLSSDEIKQLNVRDFAPITKKFSSRTQQGFQSTLNKIKKIVDNHR